MKNERKAAPSKLVNRFDMELKAVLLADLKAYRAKFTSIRKANDQDHLNAA